MRDWRVTAAVIGLCLIHYFLAVASARNKSCTYDEIAHLTRGYSYKITDDFRLGPPHPPLAHYWAALGGAGLNVKFPKLDQSAWHTSNMWEIGRQFFYYRNMGNADIIDTLLFRGRAMIAIWSVACGLLVYFGSSRLFGTTGGLMSLTLYAFSPTMLAHARLVTTDMAVTLFMLSSLSAIAWVLSRISPASVLVGGISLAGLFLAKMSAVLIVPVGLLLILIRVIHPSPVTVKLGPRERVIASRLAKLGCWLGVMVVWMLMAWMGIWTAYGWRYEGMQNAQPGRYYSNYPIKPGKTEWETSLRSLDHLAGPINWLRSNRVLPEPYLYSIVYGAQTARGRNAFLCGEVNILGFRSYFPIAFAIKTPLPLMALLILSIVALIWRRRNRPPGREQPHPPPVSAWIRTAPLWVFFVVYWIASFRSHLNIGHRHLLPIYPMLFILCGASASLLRARPVWMRVATPALAGLFVIGSLAAFPNYLAYFNWIVGGPKNAHRHLVDSSLDWGQDLPGLKRYLDRLRADGDTRPAYVSYFGSGHQLAVSHHGIDATHLPMNLANDATGDYALHPGVYCISATVLQQLYYSAGEHRWTPKLEEEYQRHRASVAAFLQAPNTVDARSAFATGQFPGVFRRYDRLRLGRLCAVLRQRKPFDQVNYSILIYNLDESTLNEALEGPAPFEKH